MTPLEQFRQAAQIPADFGQERPYVRLAFVDESQICGADADVEFWADKGHVSVKVTEWHYDSRGRDRVPVVFVVFDFESGAILNDEGESLRDLITAVSGMHVLGLDAEQAAA